MLAGSTTLVLSAFGAEQAGTLSDNDGFLENADDGTSTFDGQPVNYIGSGTAAGGLEILGLFVRIGPSVDVVVFEAGGQVYFHYPAGKPALSELLLNIDISPAPYQVFTPICFAADTRILTPSGERAVQELGAGDMVTDFHGEMHEIIWTGARALQLPRHPYFDKWRPVDLERDSLGEGRPYRRTRVSQQHRVMLGDWRVQLLTGLDEVLVPAVQLVNDTDIRINRSLTEVKYHHLMCDRHVVLIANGMPAESLFPGVVALEGISDAARDELLGLFPELAGGREPEKYKMALPVARGKEARACKAYLQASGSGGGLPHR
ncbi:Hint domain-containing protein [Roseovarius pacificus]|uniref:Hint domain-containing protein n=1 Tax=Roseovarius pacificus TaxID=337701 RepID=UPI00135634AA|nr:Hint domain-containing protein [Roseovarius pacificus]